jgi:hypothetical protein
VRAALDSHHARARHTRFGLKTQGKRLARFMQGQSRRMSFLDVQDLATVAAQSGFLSLLLAAWCELSDSQVLVNLLDLGVAGGLIGWFYRRSGS